MLAIAAFAPEQTLRALGPAAMSLVAALAWLLLARGNIAVAIHLLVFGLWAVVTGIAFFNGGIRGMAIIVYPQLILILGWLVGTRAAIVMAALAVAATFGFVLAETFGMLPEPPNTPPMMRWIVNSFIFAFSVTLIASFVRSYQERLKQAEQLAGDLARRSAELHRAQSVAHVGSWTYEMDTGVVHASAETCRIFGLPEDTTGGSDTYLSRVHPDDRDAPVNAWKASLKSGAAFDCEHRIVVGEATRWVRQVAVFERDPDGWALRSLGTVQDITERKHYEKELERLNKELEQRVEQRTHELQIANRELESFAYSVSHDLRAPLRAIEGFSTLLEKEYAPQFDARGKDYLRRVRGGATRMGILIDDMLKLSRISRQEMRRQLVDLSALAREAAADLSSAEPERKVEWIIAPQVSAAGDPGLLRVVMQNLISNAWKYSSKRESARIEFGVSERNGGSAYFVRDNGAGFDMAYADKLFGAFQRLHSPGEFPGSGIGLATVKRIVHRHGGEVGAEGRASEGATFYFTL